MIPTTLPLVLFIVMTELSIGAFVVLVLLDWRNDVTRGFLVSYGLIYLFLTGLTYLFQQNFSTPGLLNDFVLLDKTWTPYLALPLLLFFLLMIPYNVLLWFDKKAGVAGKPKPWEAPKPEEEKTGTDKKSGSTIRVLRLIAGALTSLAGLATLFVLAMIYRPIAGTNFSGVFTVAGFFAGALALGGVMTAMWLGHWYLAASELTHKPLLFATSLVILGILFQFAFAIFAGPLTSVSSTLPSTSTGVTTTTPTPDTVGPATPGTQVKPATVPVVTPISVEAIGWLRILVGFAMPLVLGGLSWKLIRDHSFQSATGMLYLIVVLTLAGEAMARGLFLYGLQ